MHASFFGCQLQHPVPQAKNLQTCTIIHFFMCKKYVLCIPSIIVRVFDLNLEEHSYIKTYVMLSYNVGPQGNQNI